MKWIFSFLLFFFISNIYAQTRWHNIDAGYGELPSSFHIFRSTDSLDGQPNVMYYATASLDDTALLFTTDTSSGRRLTPYEFFLKNKQPLLVVNAAFFSFATNENLNAVVKDGKLLSLNLQDVKGHGADSNHYFHNFYGTFGILENGSADVAWTYSDSVSGELFASQKPIAFLKNNQPVVSKSEVIAQVPGLSPWKVSAAVGGGPVLVQNGAIQITNNEERKFYGKAINDHHPRTAIGYTKDNRIIVFVCEGRRSTAAGLSLMQLAKIMKELGCEEALNLDGGGSTCMLINGKETNLPSSQGIQRSVPSVFMIEKK